MDATIIAKRRGVESKIAESLAGMTVGGTGVRFGVVVTRWGADRFELETVGRYTEKLCEAAANLAMMIKPELYAE